MQDVNFRGDYVEGKQEVTNDEVRILVGNVLFGGNVEAGEQEGFDDEGRRTVVRDLLFGADEGEICSFQSNRRILMDDE